MVWFRLIFFGLLLGISSCSRSPQSYVDRGNKFAAEHRYQDADIQYRKAIQQNPQFGEAFYRLALSERDQGNLAEAYRALYRAVELMPENTDAKVKLADLSVALYWADQRRPKPVYEELAKLANELIAKNPNSFDALRLKGSEAMLDRKPRQAIPYFEKANSIKPMQPDLISEFVQALLADGRIAEGERLALQLVAQDRSYAPIYDVLYTFYVAGNHPAEAEGILKKKVENKPLDSESILQLARHYARAGKLEEMKAALRRLIADPKAFPKGRLQAGDFYSQLGDWQHALEQFEEGARLNPADKLTYDKASVNALMALGKKEDALSRLDALAKTNPKDLEIRAVRSSIALLGDQPRDKAAALSQLQDLLKQKPDDVNLRYGLAQAYRGAQDLDSARQQFEEVLKRNRGHVEARLGLAEIGLAQNRPRETLRYADEILAVDPQSRRARLLRVAALTASNQFEPAHRDLDGMLKASPQDPDVLVQQGTLAILERRFKDAESIFGKLSKDTSHQDVRSLAGLVDTYVAQNQYEQALQSLNDELKNSPGSSTLRSLLAYTATRAGRYEIALEQYARLLEAQPGSADLYVRRAQVLQLKVDRAGTVADLQKAIQLSPKDVFPALALGSLLQQAGRVDEAKATFERVLQIQPDNLIALNNLAFLLAESGGNLDQALKLAERARKIEPGVLAISDTVGWIYLKKSEHDRAIQIFSDAVKQQPENPSFHYHLGLALLEKGDKVGARIELQVALGKNPVKDEEAKIKEALDRM